MISVIGNFGYQTKKLDGQTVKTRLVYQLAKELSDDVAFYDRQDTMVNKLSLFRMFWLTAKSKKILYLPAYGHLKYVFPLIWLVAKLCRTEIHYIVIGGWLAEFIKNLPIHRFMLCHIEGIYCETNRLKQDLNEMYAFHRVSVFRNFRDIKFTPTEHHEEGKLKLVFMARVMKAKGLPMIFALGDFIAKNNLSADITIDFYGQIAPEDEAYFYGELPKYPNMRYLGALEPESIHKTLEQYDAMLLPTNYPGEGLPGSLIDSYIAGLPIIVTDWLYAREFVEDGKSGIIIPYDNGQQQLNEAVKTLFNNNEMLHQMKLNAAKESQEFSAEKAKESLSEIIFGK